MSNIKSPHFGGDQRNRDSLDNTFLEKIINFDGVLTYPQARMFLNTFFSDAYGINPNAKPDVGMSGVVVTPRTDYTYGTKLEELANDYYNSGVKELCVSFPEFLKMDTVASASLLKTARALVLPKIKAEGQAIDDVRVSIANSKTIHLKPKRE